MEKFFFEIVKREFLSETIVLTSTSTNLNEDLRKFWYWRYDPLNLMPILLPLSKWLGLGLAFPFNVVGSIASQVCIFCHFVIEQTERLGENHTIIRERNTK